MKAKNLAEAPLFGGASKPAVLAASLLAISALAACSSDNRSSPLEPGEEQPIITPPEGTVAMAYAIRGDELIKFDLAASTDVEVVGTVTGVPTGESIVGLDFRPANGDLHAVNSDGSMLIIDPDTAMGTAIQSIVGEGTALSGDRVGVDFNPAANALRVITDGGLNLRVPPGALVSPAPGTPVNTFVDGRMGYLQGVTAAAYTNPLQGPENTGTTLFVIDAEGGQLFTQNANLGPLTLVGELGVEADAVNAYSIAQVGIDNEHYALLAVDGTPGLYGINPENGMATLLDTLPPGEYFAMVVDDQIGGVDDRFVGTLRQTASGPELVGFVLDTNTGELTMDEMLSIDGLAEGDELVGLDDRSTARAGAPDGGYAVGRSGRVYSIEDNAEENPTGLIATEVAQLSVALAGTEFGVDFNPVADLLRIVSDTGQNLRVNLEADRMVACNDGVAAVRAPGFACVDGTTRLVAPAPQIVATAYRAAPTMGTFQFALDARDSSLYRVAVPNDGALARVGPLGVSLPAGVEQSFDIIDNEVTEGGVLALQTAGASVSGLYGLDLDSGVATRVGDIGTEGVVSALTVRFEDAPVSMP